MTEVAIHIHEDDCGMRVLHPAAAWPDVAADIARARQVGEDNRAPDGLGWTAVHVIGEPRLGWRDVAIDLATVAEAVGRHLPRVRTFTATAGAGFDANIRDPYGSYETGAWCFGHDAACFIKLETDGERLARIWFECRTGNDGHRTALRAAVEEVDELAPALIADYWLDVAGLVGDRAFLERYFAALDGGGD